MKFNIGDTVRILNSSDHYVKDFVGKIGIIYKLGGGYGCNVQFEGNSGAFTLQEIELVKPKTIEDYINSKDKLDFL